MGVGVAAGAYGAYAAITWFRYGRPSRPEPESQDPLLEHFMPSCDVAERHHVRVSAPAEICRLPYQIRNTVAAPPTSSMRDGSTASVLVTLRFVR